SSSILVGPADCAGVCLMACLLLTAKTYQPKPFISLNPKQEVTLGGFVTIWCQGRHHNMKFLLYNRRHFPPVDSDGSEAVFSISNVSREQSGSYSCYYHSRSEPFAVSYPSDPVELVVRGERNGLIAHPGQTGGVSLGRWVTIQCWGQHQGMQFVLNKEGRHFPPVDSDRFGALFSFSIMCQEDGGSYSCSYHSRSEPFTVSYPSDPVELVVRGEGPGLASLFPAPPPARPSRGLGANETLRAEFPITSARREHGGSYTCRYSNRTVRAAYSEPSDPVQIIVAGEGPSLAPRLPAPHPARSMGGFTPMGHSEPGSALSPGPSRGDAQLGSGDRVTGGVPAGGSSLLHCTWSNTALVTAVSGRLPVEH
uniref:Immunoglobulin domain-containing protein n=1 Tax=Chrysemys picta bellii TaxID=8478 RepID=A0A8C3HIQ7_CHRPI